MNKQGQANQAAKAATATGKAAQAARSPPGEPGLEGGPDGATKSQDRGEAAKMSESPKNPSSSSFVTSGSSAPVDWATSPLYNFYTEKRAQLAEVSKDTFQGDATTYTEPEIDSILELVKDNYQNYRKKEQVGPFYAKATSTLKFLLEEQAVDVSRFQKVHQLYKDVTLENTLKLLIRSKLAFDGRKKLIMVFQRLDEYEQRCTSFHELVNQITSKSSPGADAGAEGVELDKKDLDRIQQSVQEVLKSAERVLTGISEAEKKDAATPKQANDSASQANKAFLFRNVDLVQRLHTEMEDAKELAASFGVGSERSWAHNEDVQDKISENASAKDESAEGGHSQALSAAEATPEEAKQAEEHPDVEEHEMSDQDGQRAAKEDVGQTGSIQYPTSNQRGGDGNAQSSVGAVSQNQASVRENDQLGYDGRTSPHFKQAAHVSPERPRMRKELQQVSQQQKQQMFKTAHEGFYTKRESPRHDEHSKSKKRGHKRIKKRGNLSVHRGIAQGGAGQNIAMGSHQQYVSSTPSALHKSITPAERAPSYGKQNFTILKTPAVGDASTTKASDSVGNNMKHAMKRKVHLPNAMPRRQDVIYDLNGRPLYRGGYLRAVESLMHSPGKGHSVQYSVEEYPGADASGEQATDSKQNLMGSQDLMCGDGPPQAPGGQLKNSQLFLKAQGVQEDQINKNSLLHQVKQQRYQNRAGGKKLSPVYMRTEYTAGISRRHGSIQPPRAPQPKLQAKDAQIFELNQESEAQLLIGSAKTQANARAQNNQRHLPDIMNKTLQAEYSNPLGAKAQPQGSWLQKANKAERPVAASEKAHIYNPRAKSQSKKAQAGAMTERVAQTSRERAADHVSSLRTNSNGGLDGDDHGRRKESMTVNKQGLNRSSQQRVEGEASLEVSVNSQSHAIGGAALQQELGPGHHGVDQDKMGVGQRGGRLKGKMQALNSQGSVPGREERGDDKEGQRGVGRLRKINLNRKLSPIAALHTDESGAPIGSSQAGQSCATITANPFKNRRRTHQLDGNMDQSARGTSYSKFENKHYFESHKDSMSQSDIDAYVNQMNKFGHLSSPERNSKVQELMIAGASGSTYVGNSKNDHFTTQFSNIWLLPNDVMYHDSRMQNSSIQRKEREARSILFNMERQQQKQERLREKQTKEAICEHYHQRYGIMPNSQQRFFLSPLRLRDLLIKKSTDVTWNKAATKLQNWYRCRLNRARFLQEVKDKVWATRVIQGAFRKYRTDVMIPRERRKREEKATWFIQQCLRGYQARRITLSGITTVRCQRLYDEFHRIDLIVKGHFQRRVKRAWVRYKEKKAEKQRKKEEAAAAKKNRFGGRRGKGAAKPAAPQAAAPKPDPAAAAAAKPPPLQKKLTQTIQTPPKDGAAATAKSPTMAKTMGQPELKGQQSCSPSIGGANTLPAGAAFGETMMPASTLPGLATSNSEFPGEHGCLDDTGELHAATMRVDSDATQNMFSPEVALSEQQSKSQLPAASGEESGLGQTARVGEGPGGSLDVINEKNSEVDDLNATGEQAKREDDDENPDQGKDDSRPDEQPDMNTDPTAGDALPEERKDQDELDRESENAEAQGQEQGAE